MSEKKERPFILLGTLIPNKIIISSGISKLMLKMKKNEFLSHKKSRKTKSKLQRTRTQINRFRCVNKVIKPNKTKCQNSKKFLLFEKKITNSDDEPHSHCST